jgi:hypothetical protein
MNEEFAKEILQELISSLETLETETAAILQFLNDKDPADKEALASYLERAGQASSIRWRGARARIDRLLSSAMNRVEEEIRKEPPKPEAAHQAGEADREKQTGQQPENAGPEESKTRQAEQQNGRENETAAKPAQDGKPGTGNADASPKGGGNQPVHNDSSHNEGNEERKARAEANQGGTEAKQEAA